METNVLINDEQHQLIRMSSFSTERIFNEDFSSETNNNTENENENDFRIKRENQQRLIKYIRSIHRPHLSNRTLRIIFLLFIAFIGITSFTIALIIGSSQLHFKKQCPLYASFKFQIFQTIESNWTIKIVPLTEKFSSQSTCDFCTFYNVFTFIYCIMTAFFFVLFNNDQRIVATNDQCLIIPWLPISCILGFFSLINASILTNGFLKLCSTIVSDDNRINSCTQLNDLYFEQYPNISSLFVYMLVSIISSWIQLIFFIGIITILTIRLGSPIDLRINNHNNNNNNDHRIDEKSVNIVMQSMEQT